MTSTIEEDDMRMESLRIYHGVAEHGWDGLTSGDAYCMGGNRVYHPQCAECVSIEVFHTNQLATIEPNIGVSDIIDLLHGNFDILSFLHLWIPCLRASTLAWE